MPNSSTLPLLFLVTFSLTLLPSQCMLNYYVYQYMPTSYFQCFKSRGNSKVILSMETTLTPNSMDAEEVQNVVNARNADLKVEVAANSCRVRTAEEEVEFIVGVVGRGAIDKIWIYPQNQQKGCEWTRQSPQSNCQYMQQFIQAAKKHNISVGISSNIVDWQSAFKSATYCPEVNITPFWWIPLNQEQSQGQDFANYHQIGGWTKPTMKTYEDGTVCNYELLVLYQA